MAARVEGGPRGFAHGKVILLGEHSVVYGHPALCGALQAGVTITAVAAADPRRPGALGVPAWALRTPGAADLLAAPPGGTDVASAYAALLQVVATAADGRLLAALAAQPVDFSAEFAIPTGAGLGSSAALAVAAARALDAVLRLGGPGLAAADIGQAALAAETVFHGRPSGLDHTVAQHGGFGVFTRRSDGGALRPLAATAAVPLLVGQTGRARDTRGRVARVAELLAERPAETRRRFAHIEGLVDQAAQAVRRGDLAGLGQAMNENQEALRLLEVSCPEIDAMCQLARRAGALGAKLTGGGGGGCVLALCGSAHDTGRVQAAWRDAGFASFLTQVGGDAAAEVAA